jgi:hypothetical protein
MASFVVDYFGKIGALAGSKMMMVLQKKIHTDEKRE